MCDKLVFDLAQEVEGTPNVFVRKDWINILDNQNQNYNSNQSVIDTSQLSNSNKYMSYREAYLSVPFLITLASIGNPVSATTGASAPANQAGSFFTPLTDGRSADFAIGLKNWFGNIVHSLTLDYNGTTIIQQTPYINMWNSFKLMTSLSFGDILTQGSTIGFYPDDPLSWGFNSTINPVGGGVSIAVPARNTLNPACAGQGTVNNTNLTPFDTGLTNFNNYNSSKGNEGLLKRQFNINYDGLGVIGLPVNGGFAGDSEASLITGGSPTIGTIWKSFISNRVNATAGVPGIIQYSVMATIYLKHLHSFFNMTPLLKGVFMKATLNLNNTTFNLTTKSQYVSTANQAPTVGNVCTPYIMGVVGGVQNAVGGVNPLMIASGRLTNTAGVLSAQNGGSSLFPGLIDTTVATGAGITDTIFVTQTYRVNLSVGSVVLDQQLKGLAGIQDGAVSKSINLYIPSYTFNPVFEQAYLSSPIKQIKYSDVYQYQVINVGADQQYNNLLTNGISNVKSVLILPYYSTQAGSGFVEAQTGATINTNTQFVQGSPVWQSPFDPAGCGCTSPAIPLINFNIQVSGQNAIYNMERYTFEHFNNQLYGQNAVNGGLTDGLTSGLIDRLGFDNEYCYYYTNIERMLPVDLSVPKSIQITGTNKSAKSIDLYCFVEYGCEISIDALTGARV